MPNCTGNSHRRKPLQLVGHVVLQEVKQSPEYLPKTSINLLSGRFPILHGEFAHALLASTLSVDNESSLTKRSFKDLKIFSKSFIMTEKKD